MGAHWALYFQNWGPLKQNGRIRLWVRNNENVLFRFSEGRGAAQLSEWHSLKFCGTAAMPRSRSISAILGMEPAAWYYWEIQTAAGLLMVMLKISTAWNVLIQALTSRQLFQCCCYFSNLRFARSFCKFEGHIWWPMTILYCLKW